MIFRPALEQMASARTDSFGPASFQGYLKANRLEPTKTWDAISVDNLGRLSPELRDAGVMVFRLGVSGDRRHTAFALASCKNGWDDYFLQDRKLFSTVEPESFVPSGVDRDLLAFRLLPALTETSFVNLALASGLLGAALGLDDPLRPIIPATGKSTFTFQFRPHPLINATWTHDRGQVEIDAIFVARRAGRDVLFVVEEKTTSDPDMLAKHKLVYPVVALVGSVPAEMEVVPVYLRALPKRGMIEFLVCECTVDREHPVAISSLAPASVPKRVILRGIPS